MSDSLPSCVIEGALKMEQKTIYILVEPSMMTPIWHANSIEGLKRSAARQKRSVCQIHSVEELDDRDPPVALVIISTNTDWTREVIDACRQRNIRPIWIGGMPRKFGEDVSGTMYSSKSSVEEMLRYFVSCGRQRVALIGINENAANDSTKRDAFLVAARQMNLPITGRDIYCSNKGAANPLEAFFDNMEQYDGVLCSNDYIAANVLSHAEARGIGIPEELYVAGLGDTFLCRYTKPSLTSATRSYIQTGEQAFNIWKQLNNDPSIFSIVVTVKCEIKPRASTAYSPLPDEEVVPALEMAAPTMAEGTILAQTHAVRSLEYCLSNCDQMDMRIIRGMLRGDSVEKIAEEMFISVGTARYRLKKLYTAAAVNTKAEFVTLFERYIGNERIFEDYLEHFDETKME